MSSDRNIAYVAAGQIAPSAPPANITGPVGWLKENLFDGVLNSILTVVSVIIIFLLVPPIIDWAFLKGVWNASSLSECREIVVATHGEGATGACWAVINERLNQFIFGFYPPELYWRPILAFGNSDGDFEMLEWTTAGAGSRRKRFAHATSSAATARARRSAEPSAANCTAMPRTRPGVSWISSPTPTSPTCARSA